MRNNSHSNHLLLRIQCFFFQSFQTADISAVPFAATFLRANYLTFLYPIRYTHVDILYKKPDSGVDLTGLLSCFKWQVYVCVLAILVGVTTFFLMSKRPSSHHNGRSKLDGHQTLETIMLTVGVTCNQGIILEQWFYWRLHVSCHSKYITINAKWYFCTECYSVGKSVTPLSISII